MTPRAQSEAASAAGGPPPTRGAGGFLFIVCCASLLAGAADPPLAQDLDTATERLNALDSWLDDAGKRLAEQQAEVAKADRAVADAGQRARKLNQRIRGAATDVARLRSARANLDAERERHTALLAAHLRNAWRHSGQDVVKLLLNGEDPALAERLVRYSGYLSKARSKTLQALRENAQALAANRQQRTREQANLHAARQALTNERKALLTKRDAQREAAASLRADLARRGQERQRVLANRQRLRQLVTELEQTTVPPLSPGSRERKTPPPAAVGFAWPVEGRLTRRFGEGRAGGRMRWQGMYFEASLGAEVRAIASGRVVFADWLRGFGMLLVIDHGAGRMSLYGHADALFKSPGDRVEVGETVASVGQSGGQNETGLYLEVRENGEPVDPAAWLRPASS